MDWMPIETAPKDGTRFIARSKGGLVYTGYMASYVDYERTEDGRWRDVGKRRHGWAVETWDQHMPMDGLITHWMPLPTAPAKEG